MDRIAISKERSTGIERQAISWISLGRLSAAPVLAVPFGLASILVDRSLWHLAWTFSIGFVLHVAGCITNDVADQQWDAHDKRRQSRPLQSGEISTFQASCVALALYVLYLCNVPFLNIARRPWILVIACIITAIGNYCQKRTRIVSAIEWDMLWGLSLQLPVLAAVRRVDAGVVLAVTIATLVFAFFDWSATDLKDLQVDSQSGVISSALLLGVRMHNDSVLTSRRFRVVACAAYLLCFGLAIGELRSIDAPLVAWLVLMASFGVSAVMLVSWTITTTIRLGGRSAAWLMAPYFGYLYYFSHQRGVVAVLAVFALAFSVIVVSLELMQALRARIAC